MGYDNNCLRGELFHKSTGIAEALFEHNRQTSGAYFLDQCTASGIVIAIDRLIVMSMPLDAAIVSLQFFYGEVIPDKKIREDRFSSCSQVKHIPICCLPGVAPLLSVVEVEPVAIVNVFHRSK